MSARDALLAELLVERYGPVARPPAPPAETDTASAHAERQRRLCEALDDVPLVVVDAKAAS